MTKIDETEEVKRAYRKFTRPPMTQKQFEQTDASKFCQPLSYARYDFFRYYELVKEKYPAFAEEQLAEMRKGLENLK